MITVNNLSFAYKGRNNIFSNISFSVKQGELVCILGSNGSGKTTLLKNISGIYQPLSGTCTIEELNGRKPKLSYVPQAKLINFSYKILDFISFGRYQVNPFFAKPTEKDFEYSRLIAKKLDIDYLLNKEVGQISGGELQMCYIAKALVSNPDILILDEPESNLDFKNQKKIVDLILELSQNHGVTVLYNTHFLNYAKKVADKCLIMGKNNYLFGKNQDVLKEDILQDYFNVPVKECSCYEGGKQHFAFAIL